MNRVQRSTLYGPTAFMLHILHSVYNIINRSCYHGYNTFIWARMCAWYVSSSLYSLEHAWHTNGSTSVRVAGKGPTIEEATVEGAADLRASFALWSKRSVQRSPIVWISSSHTFSTFAFLREPSSLICQLTKDQFHLFNTLGFESMDTQHFRIFKDGINWVYGYHGNNAGLPWQHFSRAQYLPCSFSLLSSLSSPCAVCPETLVAGIMAPWLGHGRGLPCRTDVEEEEEEEEIDVHHD